MSHELMGNQIIYIVRRRKSSIHYSRRYCAFYCADFTSRGWLCISHRSHHLGWKCVFLYRRLYCIFSADVHRITKGTELSICWPICKGTNDITSATLHHCLLHLINVMAFIHFTDVIKKTNYHKSVIYHSHEDYHPCPGTSLSVTISVSPLPSHTALSVSQH